MVLIQLLLCISSSHFISASAIDGSLLFSDFRSDSDVCETTACTETAKEILDNMDQTVDPCDNFYQFACGGYVAKRQISPGQSSVTAFTEVRERVNSQLNELFKKPSTGAEPEFVGKMKDIYNSCNDLNIIEEASSKPLQKVLEFLGGWPVVSGDKWDDSKFDWLDTLFKIRQAGYDHNTLLSLSVKEDPKNSTVFILNLDQPFLGLLDRSFFLRGLEDPVTAAYFQLMVKTANKLGANENNSEKELMNAFNFEKALAEYSLPNEERRNISKLYNKYTVTELQKLAPQVDWLNYLRRMSGNLISPSEKIIIAVPDFVKKFSQLIISSDKRTVSNYLLWRVVLESLNLLSKDWKELQKEFDEALVGTSEEEPRWQQCLDSVISGVFFGVSSYYVKNYFEDDSKEKARDVALYVRREFANMLDNIDWMEEGTKNKAIEKAATIISYIGYPQELIDDDVITKHYKNITTTRENYFNNVLSLKKWQADYFFLRLKKPNIKDDWKKHASAIVVNAFYNPSSNSMDFPAAILQKPFFSKDRPYYMNFGAIGSVIGHEITHAFDDMGRQYDKDGNNKNWWDENTDKRFREKANCIIEQYGNFTVVDDRKLNGVRTQGENIADNGGIKKAYSAYQTWVKDNGAEKKLPGLKYTPNQLFWISAANIRCSKYNPETLKLIAIRGSHCPGKLRVLGPLSNQVEFAQDFQCSSGSPMNPDKKCQVW